MPLKGKKILLAITGGIAAYKIPALIRDLIKKGTEVRVITTPSALNFVTPITLSTLSRNPIYSEFYTANGEWVNHVELAMWADIILIAPLTANTLAAMANGICNNLVLATYFSAKSRVMVAPAMDLDMYQHPTVQSNLKKIQSFGNVIIPATKGELASGLYGYGRMQEPSVIVDYLEDFFSEKLLSKKKVLITAGPTYENIDPVRFIGNYSSGKMGYALAESAAKMGAEVVLVSGPSNLKIRHPQINLVKVISAREMKEAVTERYQEQDIVIMAAAVADYTPRKVAEQKIKKQQPTFSIALEKTIDILKLLGNKKQQQFLVGFALETENAIENAIQKLNNKNVDMIVLNTLEDQGAGFGTETNKVTFITKKGKPMIFPLKSKIEVAKDILTFIAKNI